MSESARREVARALRTSSIVQRSPAVVWALDWVDVEPDPREGFRLGLWFSCSAEHAVPPGLHVDDFSLETASGLPAPGWVLSDLHVDAEHATLRLSRSPAAGPWTDASLVIVYQGSLDADAGGVDPLRDRRELVFSEALSPPAPLPAPAPDGARTVGDFATTRASLLERLALTAPEWQERSEADPWMALVDVLAWAGDRLMAYQDAVATEAWLTTARRRLSLRRHARLLGFVTHEGHGSRGFLHVKPAANCELSVGACFATKPLAEASERDARIYHVLEPVALSPELESLPLYRWGAERWTLVAGNRELALVGETPGLEVGRLLLLPGAHVARIAALAREHDPLTGQAITRVTLFAEDALPAALEVTDQSASANVVLVAEGAPLELGEPPEVGPGRLRYALRGRRLTRCERFEPSRSRACAAALALRQAPQNALLDVHVREHRPGGRVLEWEVRSDLLDSGPYDRHVVAELDEDVLELRFGDGIHGRPAPSPSLVRVTARHAAASTEAAAPGTRVHALDDAPLARARLVRESGGSQPMSASRVRIEAPALTRVPDVCRTGADYARYAREVDGVLDARSELCWSGSWYTARVWVLPAASDVLGDELTEAVRARLERVRQLGVDVEIKAPRYVVGEIALEIEVASQVPLAFVERALRARLGAGGFFARSAFRLGTSLASGALVSAALGVRGVHDVRLRRFRREDDPALAVRDWITIAPDEVLRVGVGGADPIALELVHP